MIGKRVRKYYSLTAEGRASTRERVSEFVDFIRTMSNVLQVELG
jgi:DNA-binding PadR family transcriptional regulator